MVVPDAFNHFAAGFYQGSNREYKTMLDWIQGALRRLKPKEKKELKTFIDTLLRSNPTEDKLQKIWMSTPADYYVHVLGTMRGFLALVGDEVTRQLPPDNGDTVKPPMNPGR